MEQELRALLLGNGASLVGFAQIAGLYNKPDALQCVDKEGNPVYVPEYSRGVSIAIAIPPEIVMGIEQGPTIAYFDAYHSLNRRLDALATLAAEHIQNAGYHAYAQTVSVTKEYGLHCTILPHKTVALHAGLGWIGKSALFVTEQFGSALRLTSVLTDAPLVCHEGYADTRCGNCMICVNACPGKALSGQLWRADSDRDVYFDALKCRQAAREQSARLLNKEITLCGKCIQMCPHTQWYLKRASGTQAGI